MKKTGLILTLFLLLIVSVSAQIDVYEFYLPGCPHCANVANSGILEKVDEIDNVNVHSLDASENYQQYTNFKTQLQIPDGVPLAVIDCDGKASYLLGDTTIINELEKRVTECVGTQLNNTNSTSYSIGLGEIITAGLIDSINPCAFGVLLFLMVSLLNMGSSIKALKSGLLYSLIIFLTYFFAGLGIFKVIQQLTSIRNIIYLSVGIFVLILGLIELRDFFWATKGKESILKIPTKAKPFIEKYTKKGTIIAILILGVIVALFELPCTGGIYLGIISLLQSNETLAIFYLIIYNIIFVLPLIILTFIVYFGLPPEKLQQWSNHNRAWMKLAAAIVMFVMAAILFWVGIK